MGMTTKTVKIKRPIQKNMLSLSLSHIVLPLFNLFGVGKGC